MPRAREIGSKMPHLFLFHLLGSWLLLSQFPREIQGQEMEVYTKCNLELVRFFIHVCGTHVWAEDMREQWAEDLKEQQAEDMRKQRKTRSGPSAGESYWDLKFELFPYNLLF